MRVFSASVPVSCNGKPLMRGAPRSCCSAMQRVAHRERDAHLRPETGGLDISLAVPIASTHAVFRSILAARDSTLPDAPAHSFRNRIPRFRGYDLLNGRPVPKLRRWGESTGGSIPATWQYCVLRFAGMHTLIASRSASWIRAGSEVAGVNSFTFLRKRATGRITNGRIRTNTRANNMRVPKIGFITAFERIAPDSQRCGLSGVRLSRNS